MPVSTPVAPLPPVAAEQAPGPLLRTNPEIAEVLRQEAARRAGSLRPIATENFTRAGADHARIRRDVRGFPERYPLLPAARSPAEALCATCGTVTRSLTSPHLGLGCGAEMAGEICGAARA